MKEWRIAVNVILVFLIAAGVIALIVIDVLYNREIRKCPDISAQLGSKIIVAKDEKCVREVQTKYKKALIVALVLTVCLIVGLIYMCVRGDNGACLLAYILTDKLVDY